MAAPLTVCGRLINFVRPTCSTSARFLKSNEHKGHNLEQTRTKYVSWLMHKDNRRRKTFEEHAPERLRINAIRKNTILPKEIREMADKEIKELPLDSSIVRLHKRCILTSRPRGNVKKWRISRIMFRSLADYNRLPGVTRAVW